jgi:CshA-type fibril repeat protein
VALSVAVGRSTRVAGGVAAALAVVLAAFGVAPSRAGADGGGPGTVTATGSVVSGPDTGSTTQAGAGDQVRYAYTVDPHGIPNPSVTTTVALTGAHQLVPDSVTAPAGLSVTYSTDGTTYSSSGSSASRFVRFSGPVATGAAGVATTLNGPAVQAIAGNGGGDGYIPILTDTRVFNVWHHQGAVVDCHLIATGDSCPGYPYAFSIGGAQPVTGHAPIGWVDPATNHLWVAAERADTGHDTDIGFACVDVGLDGATPANCGWVGVGTTTDIAAAFGTGAFHSGAAVNGKLYAIDVTGQVYCMDPSAAGGAGAACSGYPVDLGLPAASSAVWSELSPVGDSTRLIARTTTSSSSTLACLDTATGTTCAGWDVGGSTLRSVPSAHPDESGDDFVVQGDAIPVQSDGTSWDRFCVSTNNVGATPWATLSLYCYALSDGLGTGIPTGMAETPPDGGGWYFGLYGTGRPATSGHRVYFTLVRNFSQGDRVVCYDYARNGGAGDLCPNFPYTYPQSLRTYGVAVDTTGSCLWDFGDAAQFAIGSTDDPSQPCVTSSTLMSVIPASAYCGTDQSGPSWGAVAVRGLSTSDYASAVVTVRDGDGAVVSGFDHVALPSSQQLDISSIPKSGSTASLGVTVAFGGIDTAAFTSGVATLQTTWTGRTLPRACLDTVPVTSCSTAQDLTTTASAAFADLPGSPATPVSDNKMLTRTDPTPASCADLTTTVDACTSGQLADCGVNAVGVWASSATIPLTNSRTIFRVSVTNTGTAALTGVAATPATIPGCAQSVGALAVGVISRWVCSAAATAAGTVSETATATGTASCPTESCRTATGESEPAEITVVAPPVPTPLTSTGLAGDSQQVTVPIPDGGSVTLLDSGSNPTTSVVVPEGAYAIDTTTGVITFTPNTGFTGTATPVTFQVTDAYGQTGTATYTPTVTPNPPPLTSTGVGTTPQAVTLPVPGGGSATLLDAGGNPATTITVDGQGTYTYDPVTAVVTFTPVLGFSGEATPVAYRVTDSHGLTGESTYTPTVTPPAGPTAPDLTSSGVGTARQHVTATIPDHGAITLVDSHGHATTTVTVDGEGVYTVDPDTGVITFAPLLGFAGIATPVSYRVTDAYGQTATGTYTPSVIAPAPPEPTAQDKATRSTDTTQSTTLTVPPGGSATLLDASGRPATSVTVPGQGTYTLRHTSAGWTITFTAQAGFTGTATPVVFLLLDAYGRASTATYTPTVLPGGLPATGTSVPLALTVGAALLVAAGAVLAAAARRRGGGYDPGRAG